MIVLIINIQTINFKMRNSEPIGRQNGYRKSKRVGFQLGEDYKVERQELPYNENGIPSSLRKSGIDSTAGT